MTNPNLRPESIPDGARRPGAAPRQGGRPRLLAGVLSLGCFAGVIGVWWLSVANPTGQAMEQAAFAGSLIGARFVSDHARSLLHIVSLPAAIGLVLVVLVGALWRGSRRRALWAAIAVVAINLSTQVLKYLVLWRPDYGLSQRFGGMNTLPSGHTAMAASAAVALILVTRPQWRSGAAGAGALLAAAMGYSTLVCQWHRPGDVIAALLLATAWGSLAVAGGAWADEEETTAEPARTQQASTLLGPATGQPLPPQAALPQAPSPRRRMPGRALGQRTPGAAILLGLGILAGAAALVLAVLNWQGVMAAGGAPTPATIQALGRTGTFIAYAAGAVGTVAVACTGMGALALLTPREAGQGGALTRPYAG
ncbi:phosphatase PAP2 family protein [Actinomyces sp. 594]|uniref:phosphatase PAP2 family protein n=1 Tax=Actinomyces sp. 594 TaxID=2057793 RepID=UPI001C59DD88|nr:phosphatase PAP2 family protein [Actinomyces sp. 594]MBW3067977.1 phosphatase PAP2 family protein [Actinomyces sp. 594]